VKRRNLPTRLRPSPRRAERRRAREHSTQPGRKDPGSEKKHQCHSGSPGGGISVKLRGVTSVYGNTQPLYVVDGVFVDIRPLPRLECRDAGTGGWCATGNQDNPSSRIADIRPRTSRISRSKGASAAAVYDEGRSRGHHHYDQKRQAGPHESYFSQTWASSRYASCWRTAIHRGYCRSLSSDSARAYYWAGIHGRSIRRAHHDYEKRSTAIPGFARNTVLSVSGGTEKTGVYFSVSTGRGRHRKKYRVNNTSFRLNVDHK